MKSTWILVANSSKARIFNATSIKNLEEITLINHQESRLHEAELTSDNAKADKHKGFGTTHHDAEVKLSHKKQEAIKFVKEISSYLSTAIEKNKLNRLYILANSNFLGLLREHLANNIIELIHQDINKDLTNLPKDEILKHIDIFI